MKLKLLEMAMAGAALRDKAARPFSYKPRAMTAKQHAKRLLERLREKGLWSVYRHPAKLLKRFNASGNRAKHATAVQRPCYGRRSERAKV